MSIDDTDKFEQKEMKKRPVKNTWHDRLTFWKTFEKSNLTIALNILYIKDEEICPAYIS